MSGLTWKIFCKRMMVIIYTILVLFLEKVITEFNPKVNLKSCANSKLILDINGTADGGLLYIQGKGPQCKLITIATQTEYIFSFSECDLKFDTTFRVVIQKKPHVQTASDQVIPMVCILSMDDILVKGVLSPSGDDDDKGHNITIRPTAYMRVKAKDHDVSNGIVTLGDHLTMEIDLDEPYKDHFDIKAQDCTAALIDVVKDECSLDMDLFPDFHKVKSGELVSEFDAFQPTNLVGTLEVKVSYTCQLTVCKGFCQKSECENNKNNRMRRDVNEIDHIACSTTLRIRSPPGSVDDNSDDNQLCVEMTAAIPCVTFVGLVILLSWITIAHLIKRVMQAEVKDDVSVTKSVGRRLSSVFNMPTGYNLRDQKTFSSIPEEEGQTPPQIRRKSVMMTRIGHFDA